MTISMQTRLASQAAKDAGREWKTHQGNCPRCAHIRSGLEPCAIGAPILREMNERNKVAKKERELDKQGLEGQQSLF